MPTGDLGPKGALIAASAGVLVVWGIDIWGDEMPTQEAGDGYLTVAWMGDTIGQSMAATITRNLRWNDLDFPVWHIS